MDISPVTEQFDHARITIQTSLSHKPLAQLEHLQHVGETASPEYAAKAARGFEALFIHELYKTMRHAMLDSLENEDSTTFGGEVLDTLAGIELAQQLAHTGRGIGIAQMVYRYLTGSDQLPIITRHPSTVTPLPHSAPQAADNTSSGERGQSPPQGRLNIRLEQVQDIIERAARMYDIPPWLIKAVIATESGGVTNAISPAGAKGLMQLMDATAQELGVRNIFDPEENILAGTRYLRMMLDRFGSIPLALAAYNAGPGAVQQYRGIPPYRETHQYIHRVQQYAALFRQDEML